MKFGFDLYPLLADWSLPSRERGLKYIFLLAIQLAYKVAPFAGAWIEILLSNRKRS